MQAKSFFKCLQEKRNNLLIISFDLQKNLVLPKVADQIAYYSRQLYCYNLGIVTGPSSSGISKDNVSIYTWCEHEMQKSSNQVASAVYNELLCRSQNGDLNDQITTLHVAADDAQHRTKILLC